MLLPNRLNYHFKVAALLCASGVTDKRLYTLAHPDKAMTFDGKTCPACTTMRLRIVTRSGATGNVLSLRCEDCGRSWIFIDDPFQSRVSHDEASRLKDR